MSALLLLLISRSLLGIIGGISDAIIKDRFFPNATSSRQSIMSGVLTASLLLGAFAGSFLGVDAGNRFGHRLSFRFTGISCIIASVALALMPNFELICIVRMLLGVSVGFTSALAPWYVNDAIPAATRGSLGTIFQISVCAFILVGEICNYAFHPDENKDNIHVDEWKWKLQLGLSAAPGLFMLAVAIVMHESPVYLARLSERQRRSSISTTTTGGNIGGDIEDGAIAMDSFDKKKSGKDQDLGAEDDDDSNTSMDKKSIVHKPPAGPSALHDPEGAAHHAHVHVEKEGWVGLFSRKHAKAVAIAVILAFSNQLTGINAVIFYAPKIFKDAGFSNPLVLTIAVVGVWNLVSVFISFALVDRCGRRPLMLTSIFLMGCGAGLMSLAYEAFPDQKAPIAIISLILFVGAFECGPGPLFFLMAVESFPPEIRDPALSLTQAVMWCFNIVITFGFPVVNDGLGPAATFLIFFCTCEIGLVLIWWQVPESMSGSVVAVPSAVEEQGELGGHKKPLGELELEDGKAVTTYKKLQI
jgi:MFS family permease